MIQRIVVLLLMLFWSTLTFPQKILIGTVNYAPPFEMKADNKGSFFGFDMDIMHEICIHTHKECRYTTYSWQELFTAVNQGKIDLAIAAITITPTRQQQFLFSQPYLTSKGLFMTLVTSPLKNISDLRNKRVASLQGTVYKSMLKGLFGKEVTVVEYNDAMQVYSSLVKHDTDAIVGIAPTITYWIANNNQLFKPLGKPFALGKLGIMGNKNKPKLMEEVNQALKQMKAEGMYNTIYQRYFGGII